MNQDVRELIDRWPLIKDFKLPKQAHVVVVGAYKGLAMEALDELYHPDEITGFEPQSWAAEEAMHRLIARDNCSIIPVGIWAGTPPAGGIPMGEWHTDACSFVNVGPGSREQGSGHAMDADIALDSLDYDHIDLMVINCEGYEYALIPYLRDKGWLARIDRLAVQWHLFPQQELDEDIMNAEIRDIQIEDSFLLRYDERPTWTYFCKDLG